LKVVVTRFLLYTSHGQQDNLTRIGLNVAGSCQSKIINENACGTGFGVKFLFTFEFVSHCFLSFLAYYALYVITVIDSADRKLKLVFILFLFIGLYRTQRSIKQAGAFFFSNSPRQTLS